MVGIFMEEYPCSQLSAEKKRSKLSHVVTELLSFKVGHSILSFSKKNLYYHPNFLKTEGARMVTRTTRPWGFRRDLVSSEPDYYSGKRLHLIHASFSSTKPIFQINIFSVDGLALLQILWQPVILVIFFKNIGLNCDQTWWDSLVINCTGCFLTHPF